MAESSKGRLLHLLPLVILAAMLGIAVGIEALRYGAVTWLHKLPLAGLLFWALLRPRRTAA